MTNYKIRVISLYLFIATFKAMYMCVRQRAYQRVQLICQNKGGYDYTRNDSCYTVTVTKQALSLFRNSNLL